jgi:hypothetical protein
LAVLELMVVVEELTIVVAPDPSEAVCETVTVICTLALLASVPRLELRLALAASLP